MSFILPLPKSLYEKAKSLGVEKIFLSFSGGSDEGHLSVDLQPGLDDANSYAFLNEIEDWAFDAYAYGGAGDGNDYGDDVTYDLVEKTASHSEWFTSATYNSPTSLELEIKDGE